MKVARKKRPVAVRIAGILLAIALVGFIACGLYNPLSVSTVTIESDKIDAPVRIALIGDLHACKYGDGQADLIAAVTAQKPDLICLIGDIFHEHTENDNAETFLSRIVDIAPCYFVTGNHEYYQIDEDTLRARMALIEEYGITLLSNAATEVEVCGQTIVLCGIDDLNAAAFDETFRFSDTLYALREQAGDDHLTILLSHRPEYFSTYAACGFDLSLCGHAHGGQWRVPGLLKNGLYAPGQGFFPQYTTGKYTDGDAVMVVTRGLAKKSGPVPRFYNRPEITMVEIR